jgi:hypothetical protein
MRRKWKEDFARGDAEARRSEGLAREAAKTRRSEGTGACGAELNSSSEKTSCSQREPGPFEAGKQQRNTPGVTAGETAPPHPSAACGVSLPLPNGERESRVAFREGVDASTIEILSFDASGACMVHKVGGLALGNLAVLAVGAMRRAAGGVR